MPGPPASRTSDGDAADSVDGSGLVSDDSSFYGDDDQRATLSDQAAAFSPVDFLSDQPQSRLLRAFHTADSAAAPSRKLFNPFQDAAHHARQLDETVAEFVARLPPSSTPVSAVKGWIWIANPHSARRPTDEGDLAGLHAKGSRILRDLQDQVEEITESDKARATKTRRLNKARDEAKRALLDAAAAHGVRAGKWMLFPAVRDVDRVWRTVAEATADGRLGHAAKVAPNDGDRTRQERLICVYTADFADEQEVRRVLLQLDALNLAKTARASGEAKWIYYKTDAYTHLDITGQHPSGLKASLYNSKDMLK